jgi:hypothetical protein
MGPPLRPCPDSSTTSNLISRIAAITSEDMEDVRAQLRDVIPATLLEPPPQQGDHGWIKRAAALLNPPTAGVVKTTTHLQGVLRGELYPAEKFPEKPVSPVRLILNRAVNAFGSNSDGAGGKLSGLVRAMGTLFPLAFPHTTQGMVGGAVGVSVENPLSPHRTMLEPSAPGPMSAALTQGAVVLAPSAAAPPLPTARVAPSQMTPHLPTSAPSSDPVTAPLADNMIARK